MFKRSLVFTLIIICLLSIFSINNISYAGPGLGDWTNAREKVHTAESVMKTERDQYHQIQGDLKELNGQWDDDISVVNGQRLVTVLATTGAIISVASGGSLYPAAYVIAVTTAKLTHTETSSNASEYMTSMRKLLSLMDTARANVDAAYNGGDLTVEPHGGYPGIRNTKRDTPGYVPEYDAYLTFAVEHLNGHEYYVGNYNNKVTLTFGVLESSVKMGGTSGYYHRGIHDGDEDSQTDHVFARFMTFADFVVNPDLPSKYTCKSPCPVTFRTPYEALTSHTTDCGTGKNIDVEAIERYGEPYNGAYLTGTHDHIVTLLLYDRDVATGCGRSYYTCSTIDEAAHRSRTCKTWVVSSQDVCGQTYRNCMGHGAPHQSSTNTSHSDDAGSGTSTTNQQVVAPPTPTPTPTTVTYTCGIHSGSASSESSDHSTTVSGYSGSFYECQSHQTFGCGHTDLSDNASTHSQTYCYDTNANGDTCEIGNYYACQTHTCDFPAIACGSRSWTNCMASVSSSTQHYVASCSNCTASYWSCNPRHGSVNHEVTHTCTRSGCGATYTNCTKGDGTCSGGTYVWHN